MKKILVPTDFSDTANNAVDYAMNIAKTIGAEVVLLHSFDIPVVVGDFPVITVTVQELEEVNTKKLDKVKSDLQVKFPEVSIQSIVKVGFVFDAIEEVATHKAIDLIVIGINGVGKLAEVLMGSNATRVIKKINCPTITIPEGATYSLIKRIAFSCDYNDIEGSTALDKIVDFVKLFDAELLIVNIGKHRKKRTFSEELSGRLLEYVFENVSDSLDMDDNIDYSVHVRKDDDIVHGINRFVDRHNIDLLVMIPRKHNVFVNLFTESNTEKMAFHTHVPLLTLHEENE